MWIKEDKMRMPDAKNHRKICVFRLIEPENFPGFWPNMDGDHCRYFMTKTGEVVRTKVKYLFIFVGPFGLLDPVRKTVPELI
jgi:hypothetical protein